MRLRKYSVIFCSVVLFTLFNCNSVEPPPDNAGIDLSLEDAASIEAWLKLTTTNLQLPITVILKQSTTGTDAVSQDIILNYADTILYIDSLLPNITYSFHAVTHPSNHAGEVKSNVLSVTTMDTTSHNFTWQSWTFGEHSSSVLRDVAIIDENNIWAVGEIFLNDSLGQPDPHAYNAVHWDGIEWKVKKITVEFRGNFITPPLEGVFTFSSSDIWLVGSLPIHGDGNTWEIFDLRTTVDPNLSLSRAWGQSSNDIYFVGRAGSIAHYNGTSWQKLESGTDVDLKDIYGTPDGKTIWISGYEDFKPTVLLKISNSIIETVFSSRDYLFVFDSEHISGGIGGVWTNNNNFVYLTTWYSLYRKSIYTDSSQAEALRSGSPVIFFGLRSRGTDINNIFTIGFRNTVHHFNGVTFRTYQEPSDDNVTYYSLDVKSNLSVLCGQKYENGISDKAIITLIK